jgi:hypothetical protein
MGEQSHPSAHRSPVPVGIQTEHGKATGRQGHQSGTYPQQAGFAGTVRPLDQDRLAYGHLEVDPGQKREPTRERDRPAKGELRGPWAAANVTGAASR